MAPRRACARRTARRARAPCSRAGCPGWPCPGSAAAPTESPRPRPRPRAAARRRRSMGRRAPRRRCRRRPCRWQAGACLAGGAAGVAALGLRPAPNGTLPRPLKREVKALGPPLSGGKRPRGDGGPPFVWADQGAGPHPAGVRLVRPARLQEALCAGAQWSVPALCWSW